jgi:hypothetical protein
VAICFSSRQPTTRASRADKSCGIECSVGATRA